MNNQNIECCPKFYLEKWDKKIHNWQNKPFIKESLRTLFHMPFPPTVGKKITRMCQAAQNAKMLDGNKENVLILFRDPSAFKSEIYLSVTGPVPSAKNANISGAFASKVFSGAYNAVPKFLKEMDEYLASMDKKAKDYYIHYAYCPKCAKKYGDNYMIIFALI